MRRSVRITLWVLVVVALVLPVVIHFAADALARVLVESVLSRVTGFEVGLERMDVRLLRRDATLYGLHLANPPSFEERDAVEIRRLHVETTWKAVWDQKPWFTTVEIEIPRLVMVRPRQGPTNFDVLEANLGAWRAGSSPPPSLPGMVGGVGPLVASPAVGSPPAPAPEAVRQEVLAVRAAPAPSPEPLPAGDPSPAARPAERATDIKLAGPDLVGGDLWIGTLHLRVGEVELVDYRLGRGEPVRMLHAVEIERTYRDVTDLDVLGEDLAVDFTVDAIVKGIGELEDMAPELSQGLRALLRPASEDVEEKRADEPFEEAESLFDDLLGD